MPKRMATPSNSPQLLRAWARAGERGIVRGMSYDHTQRAPLYLVLVAGAVVEAGVGVWLLAVQRVVGGVLLVAAVGMTLLAFCFAWLRVRDEGDHLAVRYGPVPLVGKRIPYSQMLEAEPARSSVIDGWGIHYRPGAGWIWNLWGFGCVALRLRTKQLRIGTDDVAGLVAFLRQRIGKP
jgi:hypothetical protein